MSIYLKIDHIKGNVTLPKFKDWIHVHDIDFGGINNPARMRVGEARDRNSNYPNFGHVTFTKSLDPSSNTLFQATHDSIVFPKMEFNYVTEGKEPTVYGKLILTDALISYFADKHSENGHRPLEIVSVTYTQIQRNFIPIDSTGRTGSQSATGYDLEKAQKM
jgi:type VI secretion system Hcp family effector